MAKRRRQYLTGMAARAQQSSTTRLAYGIGLWTAQPPDGRLCCAIKAFKITVLFRPLEGLLGAYVPTPNSAGMLVTTQRDHHVQRFTAAHELGHHRCWSIEP